MSHLLTNRITILFVLLVLVLMSSFSNDFVISHEEHEIEDLPDNTPLSHDYIEDDQDTEQNEPGLSFTTIELITPEFLPAGEPLYINITLNSNEEGLSCLLTWYINDEIVKEDQIITGNEIPELKHTVKYSRIMEESIDIKVSLQYTTQMNDLHEIEAKKTIIIENYDISYWKEKETPRVLSSVKSLYDGDFTLEWAEENDFDVFDKELYINAKGYTSETEYLIWVNRDYQRANVFKGTGQANEWELYEVFIISTGLWRYSTPRGVTTIPSRTAAGWAFPEEGYRVEPVVRFWPERSSPEGSSYAFHSRPLSMQTREVTDTRIGVPASNGCIRMYCEDVWWIYNNIPDHTTVVVY